MTTDGKPTRTYRIRADLPHIVETDGFLPLPPIICRLTGMRVPRPPTLRERIARWWRRRVPQR